MSVMACDRRSCPNVMCRRLSDQFGYICDTCYDELVASDALNIEAFMKSPKALTRPPIPRVWYDGIFPLTES